MQNKLIWFASTVLLSMILIAAAPTPPPAGSAPPKQLSLKSDGKIAGGVEVTTAASADDMALPREKFPGVHFASSTEFFAQNPDRSKTPSGLYILDADFVPAQLPDHLKSLGLTLGQDGSLVDAKGEKTTMLYFPRLAKVAGKQGALPGGVTKWSLGLIPSAHAATPYPLSWVSAGASWRLPTGFCRTVTADSRIDAWGPLHGGARPHTRIEYLEARVRVAHDRSSRCPNADVCTAHDSWSVGCFWPAYGASGSHYVHAKEGTFMWTWTFSW